MRDSDYSPGALRNLVERSIDAKDCGNIAEWRDLTAEYRRLIDLRDSFPALEIVGRSNRASKNQSES